MTTPRLLAFAALFALALVGRTHAQYTDLLSLSDPPAFGPLVGGGDIVFSATGSQGATGIVVNGSINNADFIVAPIATSQNWSSYSFPPYSFAVYMNTASPNPNAAFSLEFLDSSDVTIGTWSGFTGASAVNGYIDLALSSPGSGNYTDVKNIFFTWGNPSAETIDTTISKVAVVPEPSTYALLALSGLALGGYALRRRRRT